MKDINSGEKYLLNDYLKPPEGLPHMSKEDCAKLFAGEAVIYGPKKLKPEAPSLSPETIKAQDALLGLENQVDTPTYKQSKELALQKLSKGVEEVDIPTIRTAKEYLEISLRDITEQFTHQANKFHEQLALGVGQESKDAKELLAGFDALAKLNNEIDRDSNVVDVHLAKIAPQLVSNNLGLKEQTKHDMYLCGDLGKQYQILDRLHTQIDIDTQAVKGLAKLLPNEDM